MTMRIAINGFGRIGRNIVRALYDSGRQQEFTIVAINDLGCGENLAHLLQYDSTHGRFPFDVSLTSMASANDIAPDSNSELSYLNIDGTGIPIFRIENPSQLPWQALDVDMVLECSGVHRSGELACRHRDAGARAVLIGAPAQGGADKTVVYGVNHDDIRGDEKILSNASCTTNCIAPILKILAQHVRIESGLLTTIHSYSNNQVLVDRVHSDMRRGRAATQSLIPTSSGALSALQQVLPEIGPRIAGYSMRVPTLNVAAADLSLQLEPAVSAEQINLWLTQAAEGDFQGLVAVNRLPLVSIDFKQNSASSIFDTTQTQCIGNLAKLVAWYDNEWAYAHRMLDVAKIWFQRYRALQSVKEETEPNAAVTI